LSEFDAFCLSLVLTDVSYMLAKVKTTGSPLKTPF